MNQTTKDSFKMRNISWTTIILALLTLFTFIATTDRHYRYYDIMPMRGAMESGAGVSMPSTPTQAPMMEDGVVNSLQYKDSSMPYPYPYGNPNVPSEDTREFLKVYYNANLRTRDVQGLIRRVETTVRGYNGRVDNVSSSDKSGYVNFVVPQSKYEAFRTELEGFVGSRFITLNISSQNLLWQKVSIEEQQKQADTSLANYKSARQSLITSHTAKLKSLQTKVSVAEELLSALRLQTQTPEVIAQIKNTSDSLSSWKQEIANENSSYAVQLNYADNNIKYGEDWQKAVRTQDKALMDNVATVSGSVSVQWVSAWDMTLAYLPGRTIPLVFALLTLVSLFWDKRRFKNVQLS